MPKYKCPKCGEIFEGPVKFCPGCGQELKIEGPATGNEKPRVPGKKYKCPKCGTIFEGEVKFCPGCGAEIRIKADKEAPKEEPKVEEPAPAVEPSAPVEEPKVEEPQVEEKTEEPVEESEESYDPVPFVEEKPAKDPVVKQGSKAKAIVASIFSLIFSLSVISVGIIAAIIGMAMVVYCGQGNFLPEGLIDFAGLTGLGEEDLALYAAVSVIPAAIFAVANILPFILCLVITRAARKTKRAKPLTVIARILSILAIIAFIAGIVLAIGGIVLVLMRYGFDFQALMADIKAAFEKGIQFLSK